MHRLASRPFSIVIAVSIAGLLCGGRRLVDGFRKLATNLGGDNGLLAHQRLSTRAECGVGSKGGKSGLGGSSLTWEFLKMSAMKKSWW